MSKFEVEITQRNIYEFTVEAESEEEAIEKAYALYESDEKSNYFFDSDDAYVCIKCEEN